MALAFRVIHMAVETSDYGIRRNRIRGSIGLYFSFCGDECLRLGTDLDRLRDSRGDSGSNSRGDSGANSRSDSAADTEDRGIHRAGAGNLVLGHQLQ
jgi:hypothetical protein